jgi:hypothetical protein
MGHGVQVCAVTKGRSSSFLKKRTKKLLPAGVRFITPRSVGVERVG